MTRFLLFGFLAAQVVMAQEPPLVHPIVPPGEPRPADPLPSGPPIYESGVVDVTQIDRNQWHTIEFGQFFRVPPVVVFGPLSANDETPATLLLGEVTTESFTFQVRAWEYLSERSHLAESFAFFALEPGVHEMVGGIWEAVREPIPVNRWRTIAFDGSFVEVPVVFSQTQATTALEAGVNEVTAGGFRARVGEEESRPSLDSSSIDASLNWIAMSPGDFEIEDVNLRIGVTQEIFRHKWKRLEFARGNGDFPVFVASAQTRNEVDPFTLRHRKQSGRNVELLLGEEQSFDKETRHAKEAVGYLLISERSPQSLSHASIEIGEKMVGPAQSGEWTRVSFAEPRLNPVIILGPVNGPVENGPGVPRVSHIDENGFSIQVKEWEYQDGVRGSEPISFMVIKEGVFTIGNSVWEAGSVYVSGKKWTTVSFQSSDFEDAPTVLVNQSSSYESDAVIPRIRNISRTGFEARFFHEEARKGPPHGSELLHYLAVEDGEGELGVVNFQTWSHEAKSEWNSVTFEKELHEPYLFGGIQTGNDMNPVALRSRFLSSTGVDIILEGETSKDSESPPSPETVSGLFIGYDGDRDVDGDGIPYELEVRLGRDPIVREGGWDPGTDPQGYEDPNDSDSDGISDYWEFRNGYDPGDASDADRDDDYDSLTNAEEFAARTNPLAEWIEVEISDLGPEVLASADSRYGNFPAAVGSLNDLGQLAKVYEEDGELMLARWDLGAWDSPVALIESDGFTEPTMIRQNNFSLVAVSVRNPQSGKSKIIAVDSENNVFEIAETKDISENFFLGVTDSGYIGAHVKTSGELSGEEEMAAIRWRNGEEEQFGVPGGEELRAVISERGEFATNRSVLIDNEWRQEDTDVLSIGPFGERWNDPSGDIATDDHHFLVEKNGVKLRASLPNKSRVEYTARLYPDNDVEILISDPLVKSDQVEPDPIVALDTSSNADVVGWFESGKTKLDPGTPRSFHWNSDAFPYISVTDDGSRFLSINDSGQILAVAEASLSAKSVARLLASGGARYFLRQPDTDKDGDGLNDDWEVKHQLAQPDLTADSDSLTNRQEQALGLDPNSSDSDGDGISDGDEILAGIDPTVFSAIEPEPRVYLDERLYLETRPYERWINGTEEVPGFGFFNGIQVAEKSALETILAEKVPTTEAALSFLSQFSPPASIKWPNLELWEPVEIFGPRYTPPYGSADPGLYRVDRFPLTGHVEEPFHHYVAYSAKSVDYDSFSTGSASYDSVNGRTTAFEYRLVNKGTTTEGEFYKPVDAKRSASFILVRARVPIDSGEPLFAPHDWEVQGTIKEVLKHPDVEILDIETKTISILPGQSKSVEDGQEWQNRYTVRAVMPDEVEDPNFAYYAGLLHVDIVPDYNRDGTIDEKDRNRVSDENPWRWWVNDDDDGLQGDGGEVGSDDTPTMSGGDATGNPNNVDGMRDLVDFFPLHLDISSLLEVFPADEYRYRVTNNESSFNVVETELEANASGDFLRNLDTARMLGRQVTRRSVESSEGQLSTGFLSIVGDSEKAGVVLVEARKETTSPLKLLIEKHDTIEKIIDVELPIRISDVEKLYRHVDLRGITLKRNGSPEPGDPSSFPGGDRTWNPGAPYPDELTNGKYFVFVHGYNVSEYAARGWNAEIFKRLHQMGSRARYIGVSWHGDTGLNYHRAVFHALQTGDELAGKLAFVNGDMTVAAHSLGNILVSHGIAEGQLSPSRYYMINAAAALEAYYSGPIPAGQQNAMTEEKWEDYAGIQRIMAARWQQLFEGSEDARNDLKWRERFENAADQFDFYNFHSTGEDVVQNPVVDSANIISGLWNNGGLSRGAWANQEFVKGTDLVASWFQEPSQAGWGFHSRFYESEPVGDGTYYDVLHRPEPVDAANYSSEYLRENPVFREFLEENITDPELGSDLVSEKLMKYHILAGGIPALSYAAAANPIPDLDELGEQRNFNMQTEFMTGQEWPSEGHDGDAAGNWLHSDFRNVAISYVFRIYDKMIEIGALDEE